MSDLNYKKLLSDRQFLAPDTDRWNGSTCITYVNVWDDDGRMGIEAELSISDGRDTANFDGSYENHDEHLAQITKLRDQLIAYCAAYSEAVAIVRGQPVTRGVTGYVENFSFTGKED